MRKWQLELLYVFTLGALCLCVTTGPASSAVYDPYGGPEIANGQVDWYNGSTLLNWGNVEWYGYESSSAYINAPSIECGEGGGECSGSLHFSLFVHEPADITLRLVGQSSDPEASGTLSFEGTSQPWDVDAGWLEMTPFTVSVPGTMTHAYTGYFTITHMAAGSTLDLPIEFEADDSSVPEPSSALLLLGGFGLVEFLRRKARA